MIWIRALAYILHLPLLRTVFPGNVSKFFEMTLLIAMFDFMENFYTWPDQSPIFDEEAEFNIMPQIENIGYESHNTVLNLNTVALVMVIISVRIILGGIFYLI